MIRGWDYVWPLAGASWRPQRPVARASISNDIQIQIKGRRGKGKGGVARCLLAEILSGFAGLLPARF